MEYEKPLYFRHLTHEKLGKLRSAAVNVAKYARRQKIEYLVGNDTGGRSAALLVRHVYKKLYGESLPLYYIRSNHKLAEPLITKKVTPNAKVLFIDECVGSGNSIKAAKNALESRGAKVLSAVFFKHLPLPFDRRVDFAGSKAVRFPHFPRIIEQRVGLFTPSFFGDSLTGIETSRGYSRSLVRVLSEWQNLDEEHRLFLNQRLEFYRESLKTLAEQAVDAETKKISLKWLKKER